MLMVLWEMVVHQGSFQIKIVGLDLSMVQSQIEMEDLCLHNLVMVRVSLLVESKIVERDNHGQSWSRNTKVRTNIVPECQICHKKKVILLLTVGKIYSS